MENNPKEKIRPQGTGYWGGIWNSYYSIDHKNKIAIVYFSQFKPFNDKGAYEQLKTKDQLEFLSTSYIRGMTFNNSILIIDECQNLTFHELDSIITRVGHNCRIIFAGDYYQSDFKQQKDKEGIIEFIDIIEQLNKFTIVEFDWKDIVRSDFVRDYIMTKEMIKR